MPERVLQVRTVQERTGLGRTTLWRMERNGEFPPRRQITAGRVGWLESEIDEWIRSRLVYVATKEAAAD